MKQLFKSDITGKVYDTEQECLDAEKAHAEAVAKKTAETEQRKKDAEEIKSAYQDYLDIRKKNIVENDEAYNKYLTLRNKFVEKYGSYHLTITDKDVNVEPQKSSELTNIDSWFDLVDKWLDSQFDRFWF